MESISEPTNVTQQSSNKAKGDCIRRRTSLPWGGTGKRDKDAQTVVLTSAAIQKRKAHLQKHKEMY